MSTAQAVPGAEHAGVDRDASPRQQARHAPVSAGAAFLTWVGIVAAAARAHHVGLTAVEGREETRYVLGEILEVGVHDDDALAKGVPEARLHGGVLADVVGQAEQPAALVAPVFEDPIAAPVRAAVVDEHVLGAWWARGLEPREQLVERGGGPVQGQDHGHRGRPVHARTSRAVTSSSMAASMTWIRASRASRSERTASSLRCDSRSSS